jgi:hypothetical protein
VENLAESSAYFAAGVAAHLNMVFRGFDHSRSVLGERAGQEPSRVVPCILVSPVDSEEKLVRFCWLDEKHMLSVPNGGGSLLGYIPLCL